MSQLKHNIEASSTLSAIEFEDGLKETAQESPEMSLQARINAVAEHLIAKKGSGVTRRNWKGQMAKVAGCSYQTIWQASSGENHTMDATFLSSIAKWAGVREAYMLHGVGPMFEYGPSTTEGALEAREPAATYATGRTAAAQAVAAVRPEDFSPLALILANEFDRLSDLATMTDVFSACIDIIRRAESKT